jgi:hypothetical protein
MEEKGRAAVATWRSMAERSGEAFSMKEECARPWQRGGAWRQGSPCEGEGVCGRVNVEEREGEGVCGRVNVVEHGRKAVLVKEKGCATVSMWRSVV